MSPGYPHEYQNEKECIYTITVAQNQVIKINFLEFNLEHKNGCNHDFLQIADGGSEFSNEIGRFCGNLSNIQHILLSNQQRIGNGEDPTYKLYSTQNKMWVRCAEYKIRQPMVMSYCTVTLFPSSDFTPIGM